MKLTKKQQLDLKTVLYYNEQSVEPSEEDIKAYFDWSDKGNKYFLRMKTPGAIRLRYGKRNRELQVTSYKEDWGKYITIMDFALEEPGYICEWLSKVLGKPAIYPMWKLCNGEKLNDKDIELLEPLIKFSEMFTEPSNNNTITKQGDIK